MKNILIIISSEPKNIPDFINTINGSHNISFSCNSRDMVSSFLLNIIPFLYNEKPTFLLSNEQIDYLQSILQAGDFTTDVIPPNYSPDLIVDISKKVFFIDDEPYPLLRSTDEMIEFINLNQ